MLSDPQSLKNWQKARKLFEEYMDLSQAEALQKVQQRSDVSEEVKNILLKLIDSIPQKTTLLNEVNVDFFVKMDLEEDHSGTTVDDYELLQRIGHGGMSQVYKAQRRSAEFQKPVALKLIRKTNEPWTDTQRFLFESEQQALVRLEHPNIISFHHGGVSEEGWMYLVMDLESAESIDNYCRSQSLGTSQIVDLIIDIADAIAYSHSQLIVHKDIKPANLLVNHNNIVKVVDFGIASMDGKSANEEVSLYTPDYASVEQIRNQNVGVRSDVFSLAAVLFELLTGTRFLKGVDLKTCTQDDYDQHLQDSMILIEDSELRAIISKSLSFDSNDRYAGMAEFKTDLCCWQKGLSVEAMKGGGFYHLRKLLARNKAKSALSLVLLFAIIVGVYSTVLQRDRALMEATKAREVTQFLIDSLEQNDPDLLQGKELSVKELLFNARDQIQQSSWQNKELEAQLKSTIGAALAKVGLYPDAESMLKQAITQTQDISEAHLQLVHVLLEQKQFDSAGFHLKAIRNSLDSLELKHQVQFYHLHAELMLVQGEFDQAISELNQAAVLIANHDIRLWIENQLILAQIFDTNGQQNKQIEILKQALNRSESDLGELSTHTTNLAFKLADAYTNVDPTPWDQLERLYLSTLETQVQIYSEYHPKVGKTHVKLGFMYKARGNQEAAWLHAQKAAEIAQRHFGKDHIASAHANNLLSQISILKGDMSQAVSLLESALQVYEDYYGPDHYETNQTRTTLAAYYLKLQRNQQALSILRPLHASQKKQLGEYNRATLYVDLNIIKALNQLGRFEQAVEEGERALALSQEHLGESFSITIGIQMGVAESHFGLNQYNESIDYAQPLLEMDLVQNNPAYDQKISRHLIQCYLNSDQREAAEKLKDQLIKKYHSSTETQTQEYQQLLKMFVTEN